MGTNDTISFLGVPVEKQRVGFFEFTSCEGCQLQLLNNEENLIDFISFLDIRTFREAMTGGSEDYEIAFIEGSIGRRNDVTRLRKIREQASTVIALGSCACFGGVNQIVNRFGLENAKKRVYGKHPVSSGTVYPIGHFIDVDMEIPGCPVHKDELEQLVLHVALGRTFRHPKYPVCVECKAHENICLFDLGEPCLGPVTQGGCKAWCPDNRTGCRGCRGPVVDANIQGLKKIMKQHGFSESTILDMLRSFGGFEQDMKRSVRKKGVRTGTK